MKSFTVLGSSILFVAALGAFGACTAGNGGTGGMMNGFGGSGGATSMANGVGGSGGAGNHAPSETGGSGGGILAGSGGDGGGSPMTDVEVVITADNAYSFGYGDKSGIDTWFQGTRALSAGQIFNCGEGPEAYTVPAKSAPPSAYLYVVTWDDLAVTQGVLGQFKRVGGAPLYTGDPKFEVCATGIDFSASTVGPTQDEVNQQIDVCNAGTGDPSSTSKGWVNGTGAVTQGAIGTVAVGEANDATAGGTFPPTCPTGSAPPGDPSIDTQAHWMWYQPGGVADPFVSTGTNTFHAYLIFRVAAKDIPPPPK